MSIRKVVWRLGMCAGITLSANTYAIALFQSESVASAVLQFEYHAPRLRVEADGAEGTGRYSNHPSRDRSPDLIPPLAAGYFDMLPLSEDSASPSTGSYLPLPGGNEAFGVGIPGFINDEAGLVNMLALPDLFVQAQWQPAEGNSQTTLFTPHSYSGNVVREGNRAQVCAQLREVRRSRLESRDGDCIGFGGGPDGSGNANRNGSRAGGDSNAIAARNRNVRDSNAPDGTYTGGGGGGGGGGTGEGSRDAATPGTGESGEGGNGGGISPPDNNNSDLDNSRTGNPGGVEEGGPNQGNGNGAGEGSGGSGGIGGNEDWSSGNGDAGNWNDPWEGGGSPPSEITILPEPATVAEPATAALLALGLAALCAVRRNQARLRAESARNL